MLEKIVLLPYSKTVIKGDIVGETTMTEWVLEPCSEKLAQKGVVIARSLVDIQQKSVPLRVENFTNVINESYCFTKALLL